MNWGSNGWRGTKVRLASGFAQTQTATTTTTSQEFGAAEFGATGPEGPEDVRRVSEEFAEFGATGGSCSDDDDAVKLACDTDFENCGAGKPLGEVYTCQAAVNINPDLIGGANPCDESMVTGVKIGDACCAACKASTSRRATEYGATGGSDLTYTRRAAEFGATGG